MMKYEGISVSGGIAMGRIKVIQKYGAAADKKYIEDIENETARFENAKNTAIDQLTDLCAKAAEVVGKTGAAIFEVHQMMLNDLDYLEYVFQLINEQKVNAEYAVDRAGKHFSSIFSMMDDDYMKARAADITDISERLICILENKNNQIILNEPVILIAEDFTPSDTMQLDKNNVLAFIMTRGCANSHAAILAEMMNIPAVVGADIEISQSLDDSEAAVNGYTGNIYIDPEEEIINEYRLLLKK